jgi:hypothetical protein
MPGGANCAGQICCPPEKAEAALAAKLEEHDTFCLTAGDSRPDYKAMAAGVFLEFDLVPKGWWPQCVAAIKRAQAEE